VSSINACQLSQPGGGTSPALFWVVVEVLADERSAISRLLQGEREDLLLVAVRVEGLPTAA